MSDMDDDALDFDATMEKMASHLLSEAQKANVKLEEKIKVFEAVQPYYSAREKYKGQSGSTKSNGRSFKNFREGVRSHSKEN